MTGSAEHASPEAATDLRRLLAGGRLSQAISVAASLGVPDSIAAGSRDVDAIARAVDADAPTLYRLLRLLAAAGVFHEDGERRFSLTDLGFALRRDVAGSVRDQAILYGRPYMVSTWASLEHTIRTGENTFTAVHGEDIWAWRGRHPDESMIFNRAMASISAPVSAAVAAAGDFGSVGSVADIGGGSGTLIAAILGAHPHLQGIVFDQPHVVGEAGPVLDAAGVSDRCELVGGDFFAAVPGADVYLMKAILHDWSDEDAIRILRTIRASAASDARLLIVERVLGGPNEDLMGKLWDLQMLVMPGGRERTLDEWRQLFSAGGFHFVGTKPLTDQWQLIEGTST